jgi:hypothetical protein
MQRTLPRSAPIARAVALEILVSEFCHLPAREGYAAAKVMGDREMAELVAEHDADTMLALTAWRDGMTEDTLAQLRAGVVS